MSSLRMNICQQHSSSRKRSFVEEQIMNCASWKLLWEGSRGVGDLENAQHYHSKIQPLRRNAKASGLPRRCKANAVQTRLGIVDLGTVLLWEICDWVRGVVAGMRMWRPSSSRRRSTAEGVRMIAWRHMDGGQKAMAHMEPAWRDGNNTTVTEM